MRRAQINAIAKALATSQKIIDSFPKDFKLGKEQCNDGIFLDIRYADTKDWEQIEAQSGLRIFTDIDGRKEVCFNRMLRDDAERLVLDVVFNYLTAELPWVLVKKEFSFPF